MFRNIETNNYLCIDSTYWYGIKVKYRLFAFWDTQTDTLVIATHGIIKKTQKTPRKEIAKAERIRQEYFNAKRK